MSEINTSTIPNTTTTIPSTTTTVPSGGINIDDLPVRNLVDKQAFEAMLRLLLLEIKASTCEKTENTFPEDPNSPAYANKVTTVPAVADGINDGILDAVKKRFMFLESEDGKGFLEMYEHNMGLDAFTMYSFFVFTPDPSKPKFRELWINEPTEDGGVDYVKLGATNLEDLNLDMDDYWSKDELKPELYVKIEEMTAALADYVKFSDIKAITTEEVETMFNTIKTEVYGE